MSGDNESIHLQCNDPVFVLSTSNQQLEGVVLYVGAVPELDRSSSSIYFGVRLTGASAGHGTNDGSILSSSDASTTVRYFDCPPNCGLFVTPDQVTKRNLTKLEALRLRRELASSSSSSSTVAAPVASAVPSGRITPPRDSVVPSGGGTAKSRLEELRLRREALKTSSSTAAAEASVKDASPLTASTSTALPPGLHPSSSSKVSASLESEEWKMRCDTMQQQLHVQKEENQKLHSELKSVHSECSSHKLRADELQQRLDQVSTTATTAAASINEVGPAMGALQQRNEQLESELAACKDQCVEAHGELSQLRQQLADASTAREDALVEMTRARAEVTSYQNQLRALSDQTTQRGASDAVHYKERAKLSADVSAWKRKVEQLEREKTDLEASVEDLTLDKEQLQEEKETLEEKYEDLRLDAETAQMEVEELRMELEDVKASAGRAMGVTESLTVAAVASAGSPSKASSGASSEEMIQSLQTQNARLREALIRLREQSGVEKMEMTRRLRAAEKLAETSTASQIRVEELTSVNRNLEEQVNALKDMVEQSAAFEMMVEDLSDRVMLLEEQNVSLNTVIRELEEAAELTAEMEEVQADELKAMSRDLEGRDTLIRNLEEAIKMYVVCC
jgi:chromosome segregation ATPase